MQNEHHYSQLLSKARRTTEANKSKIQAAKKMREQDYFLTGVGLTEEKYTEQQNIQVDPNTMLKDLIAADYDDLAELRRMIKTTEGNLKKYSQSVRNIQKQVIGAADRYHQQLDVGLKIKMSQCGFSMRRRK